MESVLGLGHDEHGFYEGSQPKQVLLAGACRGPMSIGEASEDGRVAAAELLRRVGTTVRGAVAIIGEDEHAEAVARRKASSR